MNTRKALIREGDAKRVAAYLPDNYAVIDAYVSPLFGPVTVIAGNDVAGWTLDDYVLPRLASGLIIGTEIIENVWVGTSAARRRCVHSLPGTTSTRTDCVVYAAADGRRVGAEGLMAERVVYTTVLRDGSQLMVETWITDGVVSSVYAATRPRADRGIVWSAPIELKRDDN